MEQSLLEWSTDARGDNCKFSFIADHCQVPISWVMCDRCIGCRTAQRVENPCFSNCLDDSAKDRTSLELFTPDRNHVKAPIETVLNCSTRFDHNNVMTVIS
jgi:hypothetical protein